MTSPSGASSTFVNYDTGNEIDDHALDTESQLESMKAKMISTLVAVGSEGCSLEEFEQFYKEDWCEDVPHHEFGFSSVLELLQSMPDKYRVSTDDNGVVSVYVLAPKELKSVLSLVDRSISSAPKLEEHQDCGLNEANLADVGDGNGSEIDANASINLLEDVKTKIASTLVAVGSDGCILKSFKRLYTHDWCVEVPYRECGFSSVLALLSSASDVCHVFRSVQGADCVRVLASEELESVLSLVDRSTTSHLLPADGSTGKARRSKKKKKAKKEKILNKEELVESQWGFTKTGFVLKTTRQKLAYEAIFNELKRTMYFLNVRECIAVTLGLTIKKLKSIFGWNVNRSNVIYEKLFGSDVYMLRSNRPLRADVYHLAYVGEDGSISRTKENFLNFIRERKEVKLRELLEAFALGESKKMRIHLLNTMFGITAKGCIEDVLQKCLPGDEFDMSELYSAKSDVSGVLMLDCSISWIGV